MSAILAMMTMIQFYSAPMQVSSDENRVNIILTNTISYDINNAWNRNRYSGLHNDTKTIWLDNIRSNKKKTEEVNIITEWIVPVTVTAGIGGIVYAIYHYRGR